MKNFWVIKVYDAYENWYDNAFIENSYDAIRVARFYRDSLGYRVQLWYDDKDLSSMLDSVHFVRVSSEGEG